MASGYLLGLGRDVAAAAVFETIRDLVGGEPVDDGLAIDDHLLVTCRAATDPMSRDVFRDEWGFDAPVRITFALGRDAGTAAENRMAIAATGLATRLDTDAGFSFDDGGKVFLRRDGELTLYFGWRPWNEPEVLARVPAPYTIEPTPAPG